MSFTFDANVLLYASDSASRFHRQAAELLEAAARGPEIVYVFWPVTIAYLRIATHPAIFEVPLSPDAAAANVESLLARPHVRCPGEADDFWQSYRSATDELVVRGNLVPDAHVVALMRQHGVSTIWTHDRDFAKFRGIRVEDPFA